MIKISKHAAERFLQRVMNKTSYTKRELFYAYKFLEAEIRGVEVARYRDFFSLPSFKGYRALIIENTLVTIIPKEWKPQYSR